MEFKCQYSEKEWVTSDKKEMLYMCFVTAAKVFHPFQSIKGFKGKHDKGKTNADVRRIVFDSMDEVKFFPRGLHKHFPNVTHIMINKCGVSEITRQDLKGLNKLVSFGIRECQLISVGDDLFVDMPNLRSVYLDKNKIEYLSPSLFEPLIGREKVTVDLQKNSEIDAFLHPTSFIPSPYSAESVDQLMTFINNTCQRPYTYSDKFDYRQAAIDLYAPKRFFDVTIIGKDGKMFRCHKYILSWHSEVFEKIFDDDHLTKEIKIDDFPEEAVDSLIYFIYHGNLKVEGKSTDNYEIALKFKVNEMTAISERELLDDIEENALEFFLFSHRHSLEALKQASFNTISKSSRDDLPGELINEPEKLTKLLETSREYESLFGKVETTFNLQN